MKETFNLRTALSETLNLILPKALEKNIEVTTSVASDVPNQVYGDVTKLRQILMNLLNNAIKFTPNGAVSISVQCVEDQGTRPLSNSPLWIRALACRVRRLRSYLNPLSSGPLYDPPGGRNGTGAGDLQKLVQLMGGDIWYEKNQNQPGSVFTFTVDFSFKSNDVNQQENGAVHENHSSGNDLKILIAEDNEVNQLVLKKMIEKLGYHSTTVQNGLEAVEAFERYSYDIVFMDISMPFMDGTEAFRLIKESASSEKQPFIVAVTAHAIKGDREKYLGMGMDEYVSKPVSMNVISGIIDKFLAERDMSQA